jgi:CRP/FNR family transcriptional regulator, cyclic AMP receptor protein
VVDQMGSVVDGTFLARLSAASRTALEARSRPRRWRKGAVLWVQGENSVWLAIVTSGTIKFSCFTDEGDEILLGFCGPGMIAGDLEVVDGWGHPATAATLEGTTALVLTSSEFMEFLRHHDSARTAFIQTLCERLRYSESFQIQYSTLDVTGRVVRRLLEFAARFGRRNDGSVLVTLTQGELASWTGASREAVCNSLRLLRKQGWIETGRRKIVLHDVEALRKAFTAADWHWQGAASG